MDAATLYNNLQPTKVRIKSRGSIFIFLHNLTSIHNGFPPFLHWSKDNQEWVLNHIDFFLKKVKMRCRVGKSYRNPNILKIYLIFTWDWELMRFLNSVKIFWSPISSSRKIHIFCTHYCWNVTKFQGENYFISTKLIR